MTAVNGSIAGFALTVDIFLAGGTVDANAGAPHADQPLADRQPLGSRISQ